MSTEEEEGGLFVYLVLRLICQGQECGLEIHPPTIRPKHRLGFTEGCPHFRLSD